MSAVLRTPFSSADERRERLAAAVRTYVPAAGIFAFGSARGAIAGCLRAANLGPGSEVLLSSFTCLAVPTAIVAAGARPVYADIDPLTLNTPASAILPRLTGAVRAVIVQHTLGACADIQEVVSAARARGVLVIEDCALALGSRHAGRPVGSFGDAAVWSLELSKTLTTGWGGVLAVHDCEMARRLEAQYDSLPEPPVGQTLRRAFQTAVTGLAYDPTVYGFGKFAVAALFKAGIFGRSTSAEEAQGIPGPGFIAKLPAPQAILGEHQWRRLPAIENRCAANARHVRESIESMGLAAPGVPADGDQAVTPRVPFLVADRPAAAEWFRRAGIELGSWFDGPLSPLPRDPNLMRYDARAYPRAQWVADHIVNLPSHSRLADIDLSHIRQTVRQYADAHPADRLLSGPTA
jgi:dTDP-4-amino-4,6-dideoxygalactose transaminase